MIKDRLGNVIGEGSLLWWSQIQTAVRVKAINPGGILIPGEGKKVTSSVVVLELRLEFQPLEPATQLNDFIVVVDPAEQARAEALMGGVGKNGPSLVTQ